MTFEQVWNKWFRSWQFLFQKVHWVNFSRYIESDENLSLRGDKLKEAIKTDRWDTNYDVGGDVDYNDDGDDGGGDDDDECDGTELKNKGTLAVNTQDQLWLSS